VVPSCPRHGVLQNLYRWSTTTTTTTTLDGGYGFASDMADACVWEYANERARN
jgi:hypothetical protein